MGAYDAFVQGIMDADTNMLETREAVLNAFKESAIKFIAEMIKEKLKQAIADAVIRNTAEKTAVASATTIVLLSFLSSNLFVQENKPVIIINDKKYFFILCVF